MCRSKCSHFLLFGLLQICSEQTDSRRSQDNEGGGEGSVLNSKAEFNLSKIIRLGIEQVNEEEVKEYREQEIINMNWKTEKGKTIEYQQRS